MVQQNDPVDSDSRYDTWRVAVRSWEWRTTAHQYADTLPAIGAAVLMIIAANYGLQSFDPPGLYLEMTRAIKQAGYGLPVMVPNHTTGGLPFAYPPLAFYLMALFKDITGLTYLQVAVAMTWVEYVVFAFVSALFARTLFQERWHTIVASVLIVVTPAVYFWQLLPPAGSVRLLGQIFLVGGLLYGLRLFRDGERSALLPAIALFAGTILSHPTYVPVFGISYLLLYLVYDRSVGGLLLGATVAVGGLLVTIPWWGLVIARHGVEIFMYAAGTHGGLGARTSVRPLVAVLLPTDGRFTPLRMWSLAIIGGLYCLLRRRWFLPVWILVTSILFISGRFIAFIEALLVTVAVCEVVLPAVRDHQLPLDRLPLSLTQRTVTTAVIGIFLLGAIAAGGGYAYTNQRTGHSPAFYETTGWLEETPADATIVSYSSTGDVAFYSERTVLNVPWGTEWEGDGAFKRHKQRNIELRACSRPACLSERLAEFGYHPDYIVAKTEQLDRAAFSDSHQYRLVYSNQVYVVYQVRNSN